MTKPLQSLRQQLHWLRWQRWSIWMLRIASFGVAVTIVAGALVFAVDWSCDLAPSERLWLLLAASATVGWVLVDNLRRRACRLESDVELALLIEQHERLENDLVGALQFDAAPAAHYGSRQLETAVIEYVDDYAQQLDLRQQRQPARLILPMAAAAGIAAAAMALLIAYPEHGRAFVDRLALRTTAYPSRTKLAALSINKRAIDPSVPNAPTRIAFGQPARFEVHAAGEPPEAGFIELCAAGESRRTTIELVPEADRPHVWSAQIPKLVENLDFQLYLGDARSATQSLVAIPLPIVCVTLHAKPPEYAEHALAQLPETAGTRQLAVLEGSDVTVELVSTEKPLKSVQATIGGRAFAFAAADSSRLRWTLAAQHSPLAAMRESIAYEILVTDDDGLTPSEPIRGSVVVRVDRPPRVTAAIVTQYVLPTGRPTVTYGAIDDFGIGSIRVHCLVQHSDGTSSDSKLDLPRPAPAQQEVRGRQAIDFSSMNLAKGDQVKLTVEAADYRGRRPAKRASSDPLIFHVTDERGVLAAMAETDQRTARQMDDIIERQLGIGAVESP
ncbi:MAG TPA: hypothetical protein VG713_02695 [Pirellulales bacterium]|nr:hypothetical protein [Pirellulales bacterium]